MCQPSLCLCGKSKPHARGDPTTRYGFRQHLALPRGHASLRLLVTEFLILVLTGAFACYIGYIDERCKSACSPLNALALARLACTAFQPASPALVVLPIALLQQIIGGSLGFPFAAMMRLKPLHRQLLVFGCAR